MSLVLHIVRRGLCGHPNPASPLVMLSLWLRGPLRSPPHHLPWFVRVYKPHRGPHIGSIMSRDVSSLSDISRMTTESDGAFKRAASSFRNFIKAGGEFPPERGTWCLCSRPLGSRPLLLTRIHISQMQIAIISMSLMRAVSLFVMFVPGAVDVTASRFALAWASRTLIMRKLKGLEDIIREWHPFVVRISV